MTVMDNGSIEIGNINTIASNEAIRKLKSILDQHGIFHIIDGIMFNQPHKQAARIKSFHQDRAREVNKTQDEFRAKYRELIIPDLYNLNFMSIVYLDSEEADFLSTLIYREN
jgi:hypothetical protein